VLTPDARGTIAEVAVILAAVKLDVPVFTPVNSGLRYDLVLDVGARLLRVQCKWALRHGEVVVVRARSCRRAAGGYVRRRYTADEIDALAAYCMEIDKCYLIPIEAMEGMVAVQLRLGPTRNNQRRLIRWATEYEFAATLERLGAVAQLGERRAGSA
jgi:hypothetical protein